jgi:hypothetical protein
MFGTRYYCGYCAATRGIALGSHGATSRPFGIAAGADYRFLAHTLAGFALAGGGTIFSVKSFSVSRSYVGKGMVRHAW